MIKRIGLVVASVWALSACTQPEEKAPVQTTPAYKNEYSAVSTVSPDFAPKPGAKVAWYRDVIIADELSPVKVKPDTTLWIHSELNKQLTDHGYTLVNNHDDADYLVAAAIILDNSHKADRIQHLAQIFPHLNTHSSQDHKGSLIMVLTKPGYQTANSLMWRSAVQAYVLGDKISAEQSKERTKAFIQRLGASMPSVPSN
ncbi:hypothetical protein [Agaribacterium sp. ZY112]|uniref:hypothetical protein n=1 Tax=Agaribacterium sp. ZY112 TaxID=3233574 RepID=UPI0035269BC5